MPIDQTEAIILRTFPVGDQDKIVVFLSQEKGLIRGIAKGARKFGNRFGASLEPMTLAKVYYYEKERKDLVTISLCDILESFFDVQGDYRTACTLAYFAEIVEEFFPSRAREEVLFRLLLSVLRAVKSGGDLDGLSRYFEAWLLRTSGLLPEFRRCKSCRKTLGAGGYLGPKKDGVYCEACASSKKDPLPPDVASFIDWVKKSPPPGKEGVPFDPAQMDAVRRILQNLIVYHLEKEPRSLRLLRCAENPST